MTLGMGSQVDVNPDESAIPETVGAQVVDDTLTIMIDLKGMVNFDMEIARLKKEHKKAEGPMQQLEKKMAAAGYEEKVPEKLKEQNIEKLEGLKKVPEKLKEQNIEKL